MLKTIYLSTCRVIVITIFIVFMSITIISADQSLYTHILNTYSKESVDYVSTEKKLVDLQKDYNIAINNNLMVDNFDALKEYAEVVESEINTNIDYEVEQLQLAQSNVATQIESGLSILSPKELSILNREYLSYQNNINSALRDKTDMASLFSNPTYSRIDVSALESTLESREGVISYDQESNSKELGDKKGLKRPFKYKRVITSNAGFRTDPIHGGVGFHNATDYAMPIGTELYAVFNGTITRSDNTGDGYGENIKIDCGNGVVIHYAHLSKRLVNVGDTVTQNQLIGYSGNTGRSTGPHLHLSLFYKGEVLDIERLF